MPRLLRTTPGPIAPGSTTECPRLFPELYTGGVAPHGAAKYHYDPANPNTKKFPPYYDDSVFLGEFDAGHAARGQARRAEPHLQDQQLPATAAQAHRRAAPFPFECDNPMDMQFGADGSFYLLTYGDGFFNVNPDAGMYRWDYVKGQRAPKAVLTADKTDGPSPLTVNFSSAGSLDADPGDSIRFEWDFGDGSPISTEPEPDARLHQGRPLHGRADGDRLVRARRRRRSTIITVGQHQPDGRRRRAARRRPVLLRRQDPVQGHGHRSGGSGRSTATTSR